MALKKWFGFEGVTGEGVIDQENLENETPTSNDTNAIDDNQKNRLEAEAEKELVGEKEGGDLDKANEIAFKWLPLVKAMFIETNPIPVKAAMAMMGLCSDEMRLPMCSLSDEHKESLRKTLKSFNLI